MVIASVNMGAIGDWVRNLLSLLSLHLAVLAVLALVPLLLLTFKRIYPHKALIALMAIPCLASVLLLVVPESIVIIALIDAVIFVAAVVDLWSLPRSQDFSASRQMERVVSLNKPHSVTLTVVHHRNRQRKMQLWIRDDMPDPFVATPPQTALQISGRCRAHVSYKFTAHRRGAFSLDAVYLRASSRWGLWQRQFSCPSRSVVHVYPDMVQLAEYAVLARTNRLSLMGVRRSRKIGQDHDFERLRDYTLDDNYKHIDWRATARRNRLTVKEYQTSQSQRIVFLLDCGRMMNNISAGLSLLDHALNAMLMLSYVALRQGDSVGLICFSDQIHNFVPARGGMSQMNHLLHASFDRFPRLVESRYDLAFLHLATHCRKRALVVLVSNLIDEVNSFQVKRYLRAQVGRHLPLGVLLRDHQLFDAAELSPASDRGLYRAAAAAEILNWRREVLTDLEHQGVLVLDAFPEDMTAPLVNRYLDIKARHLL
jgi:uncharacterized protein (DUF58 family)